MRLEYVLLNGNDSLGKKSKIALNIANEEGIIDDKNVISGLVYMSQDKKQSEEITYEQYKKLGSPDQISRIDDGTLKAFPSNLVPNDFPVKDFD
mgnify:CR=1 FL=1|jgi:hypothetical protein|tara:strand:- start:200 stop:481 length:282 start_codon:yes stop_codon:yes gene_type:complete